jgi:transposase
MMAALVAGERSPAVLAQLTRTRVRTRIPVLHQAITGHFTDHHAFVPGRMLARVDGIDADLAELDARIEELIAPFAPGGGPAGRDPRHRPHCRRAATPYSWAPYY